MKIIRWQPWKEIGLEHLVIDETANSVLVESVVIGECEGKSFGLNYQVLCNNSWGIQKVFLRCIDTDDEVIITHNGKGEWFDEEGEPMAELSGCFEIDISATPLTNSFPIRRLNLKPGQSQDIKVIYFAIPSLMPQVVKQRYTCLELNKRYRYDGLFRHFSAELEVDKNLLVTDYPDSFRRV